MTINELLAAAGLTANDEIPIWDAEAATYEPTKKITAQGFASSVKSLESLIASTDLDATPTQGSANAVQSKGVYNAIQQAASITDRGYVRNGNTFALISGAREYIIIVQYGTSSGIQPLSFTFDVPAEQIRNETCTLTDGYYLSATAFGFVQVVAGPSGIRLLSLQVNGTEYASTSIMRIYTR